MTIWHDMGTAGLTARRRRRSVRTMAMSIATRMRNTTWLPRACGFVTMLALIVAPVCAPLCSAQVCSEASVWTTSEAPCHLSGAIHGDIPQIHAVQSCGGVELPAAVLSSSIKSDTLRANGAAAIDDSFGALPHEFSAQRSRTSGSCAAGPPLARFSAAFLFDGVLRI
jgi:hypothetical protein